MKATHARTHAHTSGALTHLDGVVPPQELAQDVAEVVCRDGRLQQRGILRQVVGVDGGPGSHVAQHHHQDHRQRLEQVLVPHVHSVSLA